MQSLISAADAFSAFATPASNRGVLAAAATGLSAFITDKGGDVDRIFGISGIDSELLASPTLSLGLVNYCRVMEEARATPALITSVCITAGSSNRSH